MTDVLKTSDPPTLPFEVWRKRDPGHPVATPRTPTGETDNRWISVTRDGDIICAWTYDVTDEEGGQEWREATYEDAAPVFLAWAIHLESRLADEREECAKLADNFGYDGPYIADLIRARK